MVEFALIMPILLVLVLGIINFGFLFGQKLALNQAVREGARAAVVAGTGATSNVTTLVRNASGASAVGIDPNLIAVAATPSACGGGAGTQNLRVTATYPATPLVPMPIPGFTSFTLSSEAVFRCEF